MKNRVWQSLSTLENEKPYITPILIIPNSVQLKTPLMINYEQAMESFQNAGGQLAYHFPDVSKMVLVGSNTVRKISYRFPKVRKTIVISELT